MNTVYDKLQGIPDRRLLFFKRGDVGRYYSGLFPEGIKMRRLCAYWREIGWIPGNLPELFIS